MRKEAWVVLLLLKLMVVSATDSCSLKTNDLTYDLEAIKGHVWRFTDGKISKDPDVLYLQMCSPMTNISDPCNGSNLCLRSQYNRQDLPILLPQGMVPVNSSRQQQAATVTYHGQSCRKDMNYTVIMDLICGETLGRPDVLYISDCTYHLTWASSVYCPPGKKQVPKQVPCSIMDPDNSGNIYDLDSLQLQEGGYDVRMEDSEEMVINICQGIKPNNKTNVKCGPTDKYGPAACLKTKDGKVEAFGNPTSALQVLKSGSLKLVYRAENPVPGCDSPPKTIILLQCPPLGTHSNHLPIMLASPHCERIIEWVTEKACPIHTRVGNLKGCDFLDNQDPSNMPVVLRSLRSNDKAYQVPAEVGGKNVTINLNICGPLPNNTACPTPKEGELTPSVCMTDSSGQGTVIGTMNQPEFMFNGEEVLLTYKANGTCEGKKRSVITTVIKFICSHTEGPGEPKFVSSDDPCSYVILWETSLLCTLVPKCELQEGSSFYDLTPLRRGYKPTIVLNPMDNKTIIVNPCSSINTKAAALAGVPCKSGSNACLKDPKDSRAIDLGVRTKPLEYVDGKIKITFSNGTSCKTPTESYLYLICAPGIVNSIPRVVNIIDKGCGYIMEWEIAYACPAKPTTGPDCIIRNEKLGLHIDLSPLLSASHHPLKTKDALYMLNVCGPANTPCQGKDVGLCKEVEKNGQKQYTNLGNSSNILIYTSNGALRLDLVGKPGASIYFMCNPGIGQGKPELINDGDTVVINWRTAYACNRPPASTRPQCVARDNSTGQVYDLSGLSKADDDYMVKSAQETIRLNICRHLVNPGRTCSKYAAVCIMANNSTGSASVANAGKSLLAPEVASEGKIIIRYDMGESCVDEVGKKVSYSANLYITCPPKGMLGGPITPMVSTSKCQRNLKWLSKAACRTEAVIEKQTCKVELEDGTHLDLSRLNNTKGLRAKNPDGTEEYAINLCGPLDKEICNDTRASVCVMKKGEKPKTWALWQHQQFKEYSVDGNVTISMLLSNTATLDQKALSAIILLKCEHGETNNLQYDMKIGANVYRFIMNTPLACIQDTTTCSFTDKNGDIYDLTPLSKVSLAFYNTVGEDKNTYYLRLCRPISPEICQVNGVSGACKSYMVDNKNRKSFNLGEPNSTPVINDGNLVFTYKSATPCPKMPSANITSYISVSCAQRQTLKLTRIEEDCGHYFDIKTPVACKKKTNVTQSEGSCKVQGAAGYIRDLSSLKKASGSYIIADQKKSNSSKVYHLNICGPLRGADVPSNCENSGVCLKTSDNPKGSPLGEASDELKILSGQLVLEYEGKNTICPEGKHKTRITFVCFREGLKDPEVLMSTDCALSIRWYIKEACLPTPASPCQTMDPKTGNKYDLSALSQQDVYSIKGPSFNIDLSICKPVTVSHGSLCSPISAACLTYITEADGKTNPETAINLGRVSSPVYKNGRLLLTYQNGSDCTYNTKKSLSTTITFTCKEDAESTLPTYSFMDECTCHIRWDTAAACPVKSNISSEKEMVQNCITKNPVSGYVYDFNELATEGPYMLNSTDGRHSYELKICDAPSAKPLSCGKEAGICERSGNTSYSLGTINSALTYNTGQILLKYTAGSPCPNLEMNRSTVIQFLCPEGHEKSGPVYVEDNNNCTHMINFKTILACEYKMDCLARMDGRVINLLSLGADNNYIINHSKNLTLKYILSICSPVPRSIEICPPNSGVCIVDLNNTKAEKLSGGIVAGEMKLDQDGRPYINYTSGSPCPAQKNTTYSSIVTFICEPELPSSAVLDEANSTACHLRINVRTNKVCPNVELTTPAGDGKPDSKTPEDLLNRCIYTVNDKSIDLTPFKRMPQNPYQVPDPKNKGTFLLNICGDTSTSGTCKGSASCYNTSDGQIISYGSTANSEIQVQDTRHTLVYTDGDSCPGGEGGKRKTEVVFYCDPKIKNMSQPTIEWKTDCNVMFKWKTAAACREPRTMCHIYHDDRLWDLSELGSLSHIFNTSSEGNTYLLSPCRDVPYNTGCPVNSAVCLKPTNGPAQSLGNIRHRTVSRNERKELVLKYYYGDQCGTAGNSSAEISLYCEEKTLVPELEYSDPNTCSYKFTWGTHLVCNDTDHYLAHAGDLFYNKVIKWTFNISQILNKNVVVGNGLNEEYIISLRKDVSNFGCSGAAVCLITGDKKTGISVGDRDGYKVLCPKDQAGYAIALRSQSPCQSNTTDEKYRSSIINLLCDDNAGVGSPVFMYTTDNCVTVIDWYTNLICPYEKIEMSQEEWDSYVASVTSGYISAAVKNLLIVLAIMLVVALILILVLKDPTRRQRAIGLFRRQPKLAEYKYSKKEDSIMPI